MSDNYPGASTPREEQVLVTYGGPHNVWGNAEAVVRIHRTNRLFDLLTTVTIALLISVVCALTTNLALYAPPERDELVWAIAMVSWILAVGLGGFAAFQIHLSASGIRLVAGDTLPSAKPGRAKSQ